MNDTPETPKPCPFCGPPKVEGEEIVVSASICQTHNYATHYTIFCPKCGVEVTEEYLDDLIATWNTRPAQ
jgi:hypothetical protein